MLFPLFFFSPHVFIQQQGSENTWDLKCCEQLSSNYGNCTEMLLASFQKQPICFLDNQIKMTFPQAIHSLPVCLPC